MKTIIAGSRSLTDYEAIVRDVRESGFTITEVVSGRARGADSLGERWAQDNAIPLALFPADWDRHGRAAGPIRNGQIDEYADGIIAVGIEKAGALAI